MDVLTEILRDFADKPISIEFIRFFNFIITIYSVSDFSHRVGLPAQIIAIKMISKIRARRIEDVSLGLYLSASLIQSGQI